MANYYYFIDAYGQQQGPLELSQLNGSLITPDTMVWHEGMSNWQPARTLPELAHLFRASAPPVPPAGTPGVMPKTWLLESVLILLLCCPLGVIGGIGALVYSSRVEEFWVRGFYDEAYRYSRIARQWVLWTVILSVVFSGFSLLSWLLSSAAFFSLPWLPFWGCLAV